MPGYSMHCMHRCIGFKGGEASRVCSLFALVLLFVALIVHMSGCSTSSFLRLVDRRFWSSRACAGREETMYYVLVKY